MTPSKRAQLRRRIGIVFQDFRLLDHLTTWENVALPLRVTGKRVSDYKEDVTDLLQWVGLGDRMHSYPHVLSGGEKQRAAIARAVINKPELLLADEPTGNVDPQMARRLLRLFIELNRLGHLGRHRHPRPSADASDQGAAPGAARGPCPDRMTGRPGRRRMQTARGRAWSARSLWLRRTPGPPAIRQGVRTPSRRRRASDRVESAHAARRQPIRAAPRRPSFPPARSPAAR